MTDLPAITPAPRPTLSRAPVHAAARPTATDLRRRLVGLTLKHLPLAVNLWMATVVIGISLLFWLLPFGPLPNVLAAVTIGGSLAWTVSRWWAAEAEVHANSLG